MGVIGRNGFYPQETKTEKAKIQTATTKAQKTKSRETENVAAEDTD